MRRINFIGSVFGWGAQASSTSLGPVFMNKEYNIVEKLSQASIPSYWYASVQNTMYDLNLTPKGKNYNAVVYHSSSLYHAIQKCITEYPKEIPFIIGGDHSCAIGTWLGVVDKLDAHDNFGLIWIDAHMDAHTHETSPSKLYHGMPLSVLLGYGDKTLQSIGGTYIDQRRINPELLVLIGVRSYEPEEENWLKSFGVKIIKIAEVRKKGLRQVFQEALELVTKATKGFGISMDLDAIDPSDAPGVNSPELYGILWEEMAEHLPLILNRPELKAIEIAEFDPTIDYNNRTAEIILQIALKLGNM